MRISELIKKLQNDLDHYGDLRVWYKSTATGNYLDLQYTTPIKGDGRYDKNNPNALEVF